VKYLLDSNVWLDVITQGAHCQETSEMLKAAVPGSLATSDFSVHTVGLVLSRRDPEPFRRFLADLARHHVFTLHLAPPDLYNVLDKMMQYVLDFDDAFQYIIAERNELRIVSFDSDFDRTPQGRLTPAQALAEIQRTAQP
jgi:predicted nucleic acid-binding protein